MERIIMSKKHTLSLFLTAILFFTSAFPAITSSFAATNDGSASTPFSIEEAIANQEETEVYVKGFIVGQPISNSQVLKKNFSSDYAVALADSPTEINVDQMVFVQIDSKFRSQFGLKSNANLLGATVKFKGDLVAYFSHDGLKFITKAEKVTNATTPDGDGTTPSPPDEEGTTPTPPPIPLPGASSKYDSTYYKLVLQLNGKELKSQLNDIIKVQEVLNYDEVWQALRDTDQDPKNSNNVILLYTGRSQSKTSNGGASDNWNREHVWAKSHGDFGTANGPGTDLHHLRPTDVSVNADRGNLDFDNGGSAHEEAPLCRYDDDSWEPRDAVKGDVARMLFYMAVRYEGQDGEVDLELNNKVNNGKDPFFGKLSVLLEWNKKDPVDSFEMNRNNVIFEKYQENRNPFIDHPEWADKIWKVNQ